MTQSKPGLKIIDRSNFRSPWVIRLVVLGTTGLFLPLMAFYSGSGASVVIVACIAALVLLTGIYKFDYLHPAVAYLVPWLTLLIMSVFPISDYARPLELRTYALLLSAIFVWLLATVRAPVVAIAGPADATGNRDVQAMNEPHPRAATRVGIAFAILYAIAVVDVAVSGYIPIIQLITTGDSGYLDFGIPSVHGAFYAYANALACLAFYLYLRTKSRGYLLLFLSVVSIHLAFVTRGHLLILLIEAFVINCFVRGTVHRVKLAALCVSALVLFSIVGELRSGDIKDIIKVNQDYMWVPTAFTWLYAYSYFNVLNLENMIQISDAPYFDGIMLNGLLPSIIRPESTHEVSFELPAMNVLSYIYPMYMDIGPIGVILCTAILGAVTTLVYRRALQACRFGYVASYATLFFCALLSFFVDFWFQLPVIFQVFFFCVFDRLFFKREKRPQTLRLAPAKAVH